MNEAPAARAPTAPLRTEETKRAILRDRAKRLACEPPPQRPPSDSLEILEFALAQERYAVETSWVREVYPLKDLTPVPGTPSFIRGLVNVRGKLLPVLDIKRFFGLPERGLTDLHRLIIVGTPDLEVGLLADATIGVGTIRAAALHPSLPTLTAIRQDYLKGVTGDRLAVLDLARLLTDPKLCVRQDSEP
jgi:purine-binding chemotaxis protein CheW